MTKFFFYKALKNEELIQKISLNYELSDGYTFVHYYDKDNDVLEIGNKDVRKSVLLCGKIVSFNSSLQDVLHKISTIDECKFKDFKEKYYVETIYATDNITNNSHKVYIIC